MDSAELRSVLLLTRLRLNSGFRRMHIVRVYAHHNVGQIHTRSL